MQIAPIALFVYNRPWHTQQTLISLTQNKLAKDSVLYIYADGPRDDTTKENMQKILETRNAIRREKWCKEVIIIEAERNMGLAKSVVSGVTNIINKHGSIIVLEDDILVSPFFLEYMNDGLNGYRDEPKVICIHGYNYPIKTEGLPETFFIKGADCWGWATWAPEWGLLDMDSGKLIKDLEDSASEYEFDIQGSYPYMQMLKDQRDNKISSWAICWYASAFLKNKYTLYPKSSVIYNIGFDKTGTHGADFDNFNNEQWNNAKPVMVDIQNNIETNQIALSRWKEYHNKSKNVSLEKTVNTFHKLKTLGKRVFRKIFQSINENKLTSEIMWSGNYNSWQDAEDNSLGYSAEGILEKVKDSILKVKKGEAAYERDSVVFNKLDFSQELLSIFKSIGFENDGALNVLDFGGSLGSTYFQYRNLLNDIKDLNWNVVEQPHFVSCGKQFIEEDGLKFYNSIDDALITDKTQILLLASVLQYLRDPDSMIEIFLKYQFDYIILDRTGFIDDKRDRITVQNVPEYIYNASYPVWFFNEKKFIKRFTGNYKIIQSYLSEFSPPVLLEDGKNAYWKGFILKNNS